MSLHSVWLYMLALGTAGIAGMALGNRGKPAEVRRRRWLKTVSYIAITCTLLCLALHGGAPLRVAGVLIVIGGAVELGRAALLGPRDRALRSYRACAVVLYAALSIGFLHFLASAAVSRIVFLFFVVFCFDAFSQVVGQIVGSRRLSPGISPNKTIEGFVGGLCAALLAAWIASPWAQLASWSACGVLIALSSLAGDLAASHFKRRHRIKDFSDWIPGQGGFLDRFDSLIAAGAVFGLLI